MTQKTCPRVRIAPSPTGDPHIGTAYIALFNYVFARKNGGKFIVRIEDTDRTRYRKESESMILGALKWLGLSWDEGPDIGGGYGPYKQSERNKIYEEHVEKLIASGHAYRCFCTTERLEAIRTQAMAEKRNPGYDRQCRNLDKAETQQGIKEGLPSVVRFKAPLEGKTEFSDRLRGKVEFENERLDDLVLIKADGFPTYHLANVVDDRLMGITHVIRGEEWVSSTPKHVLLYRAFGWELPEFIHLNLLRNPDKSKVSKRKNPTSILYYKRKGIVPSALRNFLALMGWNPGNDQEIFSTEEMIHKFDWDQFNLGGPVFDLSKLLWMNAQYLKKMSDDEWVGLLREGLLSDQYLKKVVPLVRERVEALEDFIPRTLTFFSGDHVYKDLPLVPLGVLPKEVASWLITILESLENLDEWSEGAIKGVVEAFQTENNLKSKDLFMTLRVAATGSTVSPGLFESLVVLGKEIVMRRFRLAIAHCKTLK